MIRRSHRNVNNTYAYTCKGSKAEPALLIVLRGFITCNLTDHVIATLIHTIHKEDRTQKAGGAILPVTRELGVKCNKRLRSQVSSVKSKVNALR